MNAAEQISALHNAIQAQIPAVRAAYPTLEMGARLMRRHGAASIEEAINREALARVKRDEWATVTRAA